MVFYFGENYWLNSIFILYLYLGFHKYKIDFKDFIPRDINLLLRGKVKNVGKAIKQVRKEFSHIAIIGKNEENGENIKIKAIDGEGDFEIESPNNTKLMKEDIDDLREEI